MGLDILPVELLRIILKHLDLKSVLNLYDTGNQHLQDVISSQGIIKECHLSKNTLATVQTIKLDFFKSISRNLHDLDLSAIQDLSKTALLPAMKKMIKLVSLNVSYTQITILDFLEMFEICPSIKNITINLQFPKLNATNAQATFIKCQDVFANFDNVHFIGSIDKLLYSDLPLYILQKAKLNTLTYTVAYKEMQLNYYNVERKPIYCNKFTVNMVYWRDLYNKVLDPVPPIIKDLPFEYEYIHIHMRTIDISPAFESYFKENFTYDKIYIKPSIYHLNLCETNHYVMIWNKETTKFDDAFFFELGSVIKQLRPSLVKYTEPMVPVVLGNNWVCIDHPLLPVPVDDKKVETYGFKRRRVSPPNITLDYDDLLESKKNCELTICFYGQNVHRAVTLSSTSSFLRKLTFLQLRGAVRYSKEFFNILFRCCENLITLDVEGFALSPCAPPISRSVPLSRTIRNLRIADKNIDLNTLFSSMSQCPRLENVMIVDKSKVSCDIPVADTLLKQCHYLYYLCIHGSMSETVTVKKLTMLNKAKRRYNRHHLCIEVIGSTNPEYCNEPFLNVYRLHLSQDYDIFSD